MKPIRWASEPTMASCCGGFAVALFVAAAAVPARAGPGQDAYETDCAGCHSLTGASTPSGPSLKGVVWRKVANVPGFAYSPALKHMTGTWTPQRLDAFLKDTQSFAPGTDMYFTIDDTARRRAIIGYLETAK